MQHQATPAGPLTTPKALRRATGAHDILVELLLADLAGLLLALVLGALFGALLVPPIGWVFQCYGAVLHASLPLDIATLVIACCLANGILRRWVLHKEADAAWGCAAVLFLVAVVASPILYFVKRSWIAIPSPVFPPVKLSPLSWSPPPSALGLLVAAGLYLLAHVALWQRERHETAEKLRTFSRAHQGGRLCRLLEQIYGYYRAGQARFDTPPVARLKTPRMFYHFPRRPPGEGEDALDVLAHPEREIYLVDRELVICRMHLSNQPEQLAVLMPLVARLLHDYNSPVARVEQLLRMAELGRTSRWFYLLLPIPLIVARSCERRWQAIEPERQLDRDHFAWQCWEGGRLRQLLLNQLAYLDRANKPDNELPTLAERIDHLDSLRDTEGQQIKELRATLPPAPSSPPNDSQPSPPEK
jgi:hypothetical protein